jgi:hypothetical protein
MFFVCIGLVEASVELNQTMLNTSVSNTAIWFSMNTVCDNVTIESMNISLYNCVSSSCSLPYTLLTHTGLITDLPCITNFTITNYNVTNAYGNGSVWNLNPNITVNTTNSTLVLKFNTSLKSNCTLSKYDLNYSTVYDLNSSYLCGTNTTGFNCNFFGNLSSGVNYLYVACINTTQPANFTMGTLNSSSGKLNISYYPLSISNFLEQICPYMSKVSFQLNASKINRTTLRLYEANISPTNYSYCNYTYKLTSLNLIPNSFYAKLNETNTNFTLRYNNKIMNTSWQNISSNLSYGQYTLGNITLTANVSVAADKIIYNYNLAFKVE